MLEAFGGSRKKSSSEIPPRTTIHDLDPHGFPNKDVKQQRINMSR